MKTGVIEERRIGLDWIGFEAKMTGNFERDVWDRSMNKVTYLGT